MRQDSIQGHGGQPPLPGSPGRAALARAGARASPPQLQRAPCSHTVHGLCSAKALPSLLSQLGHGRPAATGPRRRMRTVAAVPGRRGRASLPATPLHIAVVKGLQALAFPPYFSMKPLWKVFRRWMTSSVSFSCTRMVVRKWYVPSSCGRPAQQASGLGAPPWAPRPAYDTACLRPQAYRKSSMRPSAVQ